MGAHRIRQIFLGGWRNKGVALFFAVTIWFVAFQAETQSGAVPVRLELIPRPDGQVIIREECADARGELVPFDRTVLLTVSGPRKQIEKLRGDGSIRSVRIPVEAGADPDSPKKRVDLAPMAFAFIPPTVEITSVSPPTLFLVFDRVEDREFAIEPVYRGLPEGMETEPPKIEPAAVALRGPRTVLDRIRVTVEVRLGAGDSLEEVLPLYLRYPPGLEKPLVDRTVRFTGASEVRFSVRLRYKSETLHADGLRLRFLVPSPRFPFRIQFGEDAIAAKFQGPVNEIRRLKELVKTREFFLAVRVPSVEGEREQTIPFTEDGLLLYGFSERVQVLQHPQRQVEGKGPWTYRLVPLAGEPAVDEAK